MTDTNPSATEDPDATGAQTESEVGSPDASSGADDSVVSAGTADAGDPPDDFDEESDGESDDEEFEDEESGPAESGQTASDADEAEDEAESDSEDLAEETAVAETPGTEPGGTEAGGTEAGGTEAGGTEAGGTEAGGTEAGGAAAAAPTDSDLFRESEIAADYIEGLLDVLDYDGDIDELVQSGRPVVEVVGGRLQALVGNRGATLEALQELSRLAVYRQTGESSRLLLDVGGFRANRRKELGAVARNAAERVREHGDPIRLEPMSAFERKCVHDVINALSGLESESEGVEPSRRIVIRPTD